MRESTQAAVARSGNPSLDIANAFVAIHKDAFGFGPTKARAQLSRNVVFVLLEGVSSPVERTLHEHGFEAVVKELRNAVQDSIKEVAVDTIERLTGRTVYSCMSSYDASRQIQLEFFVLESDGTRESDVDQASNAAEQDDRADLADRARAAREENSDARDSLRALRAEQAQARSTLRRRRAD